MKRLTLGLPDDVWDRLAAEAHKRDITIGTYVKRLLIYRDQKVSGNAVSAPSDTADKE